jgi:putative oxidoreductase
LSGVLEVLSPYQPLLLLILRVGVGGTLLLHGLPKARGGRVQAGQWMTSMGIPAMAADLVTVLETAGAIFLIIGLITPLVGLFFVFQFGSIILMKISKMHAVLVSLDSKKPSFEIDLVFMLLALVFLFLGAGPLSLDGLLGL